MVLWLFSWNVLGNGDESILPTLNEFPSELKSKEWKKKKNWVVKLMARRHGIKGMSNAMDEAFRLHAKLAPQGFVRNQIRLESSHSLKDPDKACKKIYQAWENTFEDLNRALNHIELLAIFYQSITSNKFTSKNNSYTQKILNRINPYRAHLKTVKSQMADILVDS